jgi:hypothetical protein
LGPGSKVTVESFAQFSKAERPMTATDDGRSIEISPEHDSKVAWRIAASCQFESKVIIEREMQPGKPDSFREMSEHGSEIEVSARQSEMPDRQ